MLDVYVRQEYVGIPQDFLLYGPLQLSLQYRGWKTKRNEKNGKFSETKRNGTKLQNQETKRNGKPQETKRNVMIVFRNKKTKCKEKITFSKRINVLFTILFTIFMRLLPHARTFACKKRKTRNEKNQKRNETIWLEKRNGTKKH
jgi:hypothetical protein